ncbi:MAG: hypothetical protein J6I40_04610 [Mailhella sp.]|nr:hypothetical protein [Mailhella sp.]
MYARTSNIVQKSDADLKTLREAGVNDLYVGVECGLNDVLLRLNKGYSADETRRQCLRLNDAGIRHCDLLMLGTAGKGRGLECARASARLENEIKPARILINTMSAFAGTELDGDIKNGAFIPASEKEILEERIMNGTVYFSCKTGMSRFWMAFFMVTVSSFCPEKCSMDRMA